MLVVVPIRAPNFVHSVLHHQLVPGRNAGAALLPTVTVRIMLD